MEPSHMLTWTGCWSHLLWELLEGDAPEFYDDVISMQQGPEAFSGENILAPESPPAPSGMDYDNVGEEPLERGGAY
ncbi:hypothetical protein SKAU_G00275520 [Synaphobranchus kaupii]|uniref:Uncharacterized protein n=1 Tax=Synaphobranchus kaupii TaxID=118154 RepID=A0A9Q1F157_SYNKA|nr:hypothetical protein SKAU_G00275520 [Synaphobranchus kaupii]